METLKIRKDQFTETYSDYLLSDIAAATGSRLLYLEVGPVTTKYGDTHIVASGNLRSADGKVVKTASLWSRNTVGEGDVDRLNNRTIVDAVVRFGTYVDEATGEETKSVSPKIVCLLDSEGRPFKLSGGVPEFHGVPADAEEPADAE